MKITAAEARKRRDKANESKQSKSEKKLTKLVENLIEEAANDGLSKVHCAASYTNYDINVIRKVAENLREGGFLVLEGDNFMCQNLTMLKIEW